MNREQIHEVLSDYDPKEIKIGVLGSHSALEMGHGAKQEGFEVVVVCQKGREKTYTKHYRNLFDHVLLVDKFSDIIKEENQAKLRRLNTIFVPNRSFSVYTGYDNIEQKFKVPLLGNRFMLRSEERNVPRNQYDLIRQAGLNLPKIFGSPEEIDRLAIVKVPEKTRSIERAFFYASSPEEFKKRSEERIKKGIIDREDLKESVIEEYIVGAKFNANYFYSPITRRNRPSRIRQKNTNKPRRSPGFTRRRTTRSKTANTKRRNRTHGRNNARITTRKNLGRR